MSFARNFDKGFEKRMKKERNLGNNRDKAR